MTTAFQGWFVIHMLGLAVISTMHKFDVSIPTRYEDRKSNTKSKNSMVWVIGVTQGHWK